ncbi:hypothetical protein [Candidatus Poriferisodalis sp.]|uniref:hypothetical protein n=1 Tax=Candidatus Poriferisodalis sp. TaxID=3101277 RepID=UPI003D0D0C97
MSDFGTCSTTPDPTSRVVVPTRPVRCPAHQGRYNLIGCRFGYGASDAVRAAMWQMVVVTGRPMHRNGAHTAIVGKRHALRPSECLM